MSTNATTGDETPGTNRDHHEEKSTEAVASSLAQAALERDHEQITTAVNRMRRNLTDEDRTLTTDDVERLENALESIQLLVDYDLYALAQNIEEGNSDAGE